MAARVIYAGRHSEMMITLRGHGFGLPLPWQWASSVELTCWVPTENMSDEVIFRVDY